jgi:hypothetical protein
VKQTELKFVAAIPRGVVIPEIMRFSRQHKKAFSDMGFLPLCKRGCALIIDRRRS